MDSENDYFNSAINSEEPVANITSIPVDQATTTFQYNVRVPKEYTNDYMVQIRASDLTKARKILQNAEEKRFPTHEVLLAISTTCLGCILGALCSQVQLNSVLGVVIYIFASILCCGTFVAYIFVRRSIVNSNATVACEALEYLADPETSVGGYIDEHK